MDYIRQRTLEQNLLSLTSCAGRPPQYALAPCKLTFYRFDLERGVRVTCDVGYLCAHFSLPRHLCFRLRPDVRDGRRQTSESRVT